MTHDERPEHRRLPTATGILAVLGGAAWVAAAGIHASQPEGCVGDACSGTPMREATTSTTVLVAGATVLLVVPFGVAWTALGVVLALRARSGGMSRIDVR